MGGPYTHAATSIRISHSGSAGSSHEFHSDISEHDSPAALIGELQLRMADVFLKKPYNAQPLLDILGIIKKRDDFVKSGVQQNFWPAPHAPQCKMKIIFKNNKQSITVTIHFENGRTLTTSSVSKSYPNEIELIQYLEEVYPDL